MRNRTIHSLRLFFILLVLLYQPVFCQDQDTAELWKLYNQGEHRLVLEIVLPLLKEFPGEVELNLLAGRALADTGEMSKALPYLEQAVNLDKSDSWKKAWGLSYLGMCQFVTGNTAKAKESLNQCIRLNATRSASQNARRFYKLFGFDDYFKNWKTVTTPHFIFHFQHPSRVSHLKHYADFREKAFLEINDYFQAKVPGKITYFTWNARQNMRQVLGSAGGFAKPNFLVIHSCFDQTAGHEMTHVITHYAAPAVKKTVLINEGTAVYFDLSNRDQLELARAAIKKNGLKSLSIKKLWSDQDNWTSYPDGITYPLAGAFVGHLISRGGKNKFMKLLSRQTYEAAREIYGNRLDEIIISFENRLFQ